MKKIFFPLMLAFALFSCDYLDVVPDERTTADELFKDKAAAENYLYSCYSYLPESRHSTQSIDLFTGDELITPFEHETFARFLKGTYTASDPVISYWNSFFQGLRQCQNFLKNVDNVPGLSDEQKKDYTGQVNFLIAYYHFLMARCYGPIILVDENTSLDVNIPVESYEARRPYDECVKFICDKFDKAFEDLPATREEAIYYGFPTKAVAKALKGKMLLYAASPLFNGGQGDTPSPVAGLKDKSGNFLLPQSPNPQKWVDAMTALKEAIDYAENQNYGLIENINHLSSSTYIENSLPILDRDNPSANVEGILRYFLLEPGWTNREILWADTRNEDGYSIQIKSLVQGNATGSAWNGLSPTLAMLQRFYSKNGLPIEHDNWFKNNPWTDGVNMLTTKDAKAQDERDFPGLNHFYADASFVFNQHREPRYYAWVAFQGGYSEVRNASNNPAYEPKDYESVGGGGRVKCDFTMGGSASRGKNLASLRRNNYAPTCFLNKKGLHPGLAVSTSGNSPKRYPWPIIRMGDLYLCYAEACIESGKYEEGVAYINIIRKRAGLKNLQDVWNLTLADQAYKEDREFLRERVREERMVEMYLENQNFWDMRRWMKAQSYFGVKQKGLNSAANNLEELGQIQVLNDFERNFNSAAHYLMPIPIKDINANPNVVQNPGY